MGKLRLSPAQANLKMSLLQIDADSMNNSDLYVWLNNSGLPPEVTIRLHELSKYTRKAEGKVFVIGKIILIKIIEFVKANPHLAIGVAIGVAVGFLVNTIPFLGPLLSPTATLLGVVIFGVAGHRVDKKVQGKEINSGIIGFSEDIIEVAKAFFDAIVDIFNIIWQNV